MENKKVYKPRFWLKEIIFTICGFIALILPIMIVMIINRKIYFQQENKVSLSIGLVLSLIVIVLQLLKFTKGWGAVVWLGIIAFIIHFLKPILGDLELLIWMACLGQALYKPFKILRDRYHTLRKAYEEGKINSETQKNNFESIVEAINTLGR